MYSSIFYKEIDLEKFDLERVLKVKVHLTLSDTLRLRIDVDLETVYNLTGGCRFPNEFAQDEENTR